MIPIEDLKRVSVVYTHAHCPDGLASAMILKDAFRMLGTSPRIEFLAHNTIEHQQAAAPVLDLAGEGTAVEYALFCDIAPHPMAISVHGRSGVIVLDHHKGAEEVVRSFPLHVFADEAADPGISGATLAWREVWESAWHELPSDPNVGVRIEQSQQAQVRDFAECVGARDTWQTQDARFQRGQWISKMLMSKPQSYWLEERALYEGGDRQPHAPFLTDREIEIGRALFEAHENAVAQAVDQVVYLTNGVHRCAVFQEQAAGFRLTSDVAESLRKQGTDCRFVAGFAYVVDAPGGAPRLVYSLRGFGGFDVASLAKANGGGGHTAAAGFSVEMQHVNLLGPYHDIANRFCDWMGSAQAR